MCTISWNLANLDLKDCFDEWLHEIIFEIFWIRFEFSSKQALEPSLTKALLRLMTSQSLLFVFRGFWI